MATLTNRRSGETIETTMSNQEAAMRFAETVGEEDNWLWFWIHKMVQERESSPQLKVALKFLQHLFLLATGYGLKNPKIRLYFRNDRYQLYLSRVGNLCIKRGHLEPGTMDPVGDAEYIGCIIRGVFLPRRDGYSTVSTPYELSEDEEAFLQRLSEDPVKFMAECSRDMNQCCYCGRSLDDPPSKTVGYGPVCAKRFGLPWGQNVDPEKAPNFARDYDHNAEAMMDEIMEDCRDEVRWAVFSDWLEEHGLPRAATPSIGSRVPATAR